MIADREARRERIESHLDAGTCHICERPVANGSAIHGPTGAHWECHRGPVETSAPVREIRPQAPAKPDMHPRMARANGGSLVHFVIPATETSLCGHKAKHTAHRMKRRGKWLIWKADATVPAHMKQCMKCVAKARALFGADSALGSIAKSSPT
jgi:hypothetical protein